jgi:hypothetical protein
VRFALPPDEGGMVPVALRLFARRRLIHAKHARVDLRVDTRDASGHPVTLRRRVAVEDV